MHKPEALTRLPFRQTVQLMLVLLIGCACTNSVFAQWVQTNGPYCGVIKDIAVGRKGVFFAGAHGGLYESTDSGANWARVPIVNSGTGGKVVEVYGVREIDSMIFAITNTGLFISSDGGNTWNKWPVGDPYMGYTRIASGGSILVTANFTWIVVDSLGGNLKSPVYLREYLPSNPSQVSFQTVAVCDGEILAGSNKGIIVSADTGKTWVSSDSGLTRENVTALATAGNTIFAGTDSAGIFRSTDAGKSWSPCNSGLTSFLVSALAADGNDVYAGTGGAGVFLSTDNGTTWNAIKTGLPNVAVDGFAFDGGTLLVATDGSGVFSFDGSAWLEINNGLTAASVSAFAHSGSNLYAAAYGGGVYRSTDDGGTWMEINSGLANRYVDALSADGANLFAGTYGGGVFRSTDEGTSWEEANSGITMKYIKSAVVSGDTVIVGTTLPPYAPTTNLFPASPWLDSVSVYRSTDLGNTWTTSNFSGYPYVNILIKDGGEFLMGQSGVDTSTDGGATWSRNSSFALVYDISTPPDSIFPEVVSMGVDGNEEYLGTEGNGVFRSTDHGITWAMFDTTDGLVFNGLQFPYSVNAMVAENGKAFCSRIENGTGEGVYMAEPVGNWTEVDSGLTIPDLGTEPAVNALTIINGTLYAGTTGFGVWHRALSEMTSVQTCATSLPGTYKLFQNYPNPFNKHKLSIAQERQRRTEGLRCPWERS